MAEPGIQAPDAPEEGDSPGRPPTHQPTGRWRRLLLWSGLVLLALMVGLWLFLFWFTQPRRLAAFIGPRIEAATGMEFTVASISRRGLSRFRLDSLQLGHEHPFLRLDRLQLDWQPFDLLSRRLLLDSLVIEGLQVNLVWRDSLLLPDWLQAGESDSVLVDSSASGALPAWLVDERVRVEPGALIVRRFQVNLDVQSPGEPWAISSPPLGLTVQLPGLSGPQLQLLANGELPRGLRTGLQLDWSGGWPGGPLPSPGMDPLLLVLPGTPLQDLSWKAGLRQDSLNVALDWALAMPGMHLEQGDWRLPLPDSLALGLTVAASVRDSSRIRVDADWALFPLGGNGRLGLDLSGPLIPDRYALSVHHALDPSLAGPWLAWADPSLADLQLAPAPIQLDLSLAGQLDSLGQVQPMTVELASHWSLPTLDWPSFGLHIDELELESISHARIDPARPDAPGALDTRLDLGLRRLVPALDPWLDSTGIAALPPALRAPVLEGLNLGLNWRAASLDSRSSLDADLGIDGLLASSLLLSARLDLPPVDRLAEGELPALRLDLQSEPFALEQFDPSLGGAASLGGWIELTEPEFSCHLDLLPRNWTVLIPGEASPMAIPLYGLATDMAGRMEQGMPILERIDLAPEPLAPIHIEGALDFFKGGFLEMDWPGLELAMIQRRLPDSAAILTHLEGQMNTLLSVTLDSTLMPVRMDALIVAQGLSLKLEETAEVDGLGLELGGWWTPDSAAGSLDFHLGRSVISGLPTTLSGMGGRLTGELRTQLDLQGTIAVPDYASTVHLTARADSLNALPRSEVVIQVLMDTQQQPLEVWPGILLTGSQDLGAVLQVRDERFIQMDAWSFGAIQTLQYEDMATISRMDLDLNLSQLVDLEHPDYLALGSLERPPADWNSQLSLGRSSSGVASFSPEGWSVQIGEINAMDWILEDLAMDLRIAGRRLDCPQLQAVAYGGTIAGSAWLDLPGALDNPAYGMELWASGLDSRRFRFSGTETQSRGSLFTGKAAELNRLDLVINLEGAGLSLEALDTATGRLRLPAPGRQVTLNLLWALDERGADPTIGRIRKLLDLPGFKYSVESLDFDLSNGFVKPRVALRKSPFSPLPNVVFPMSPLPLGFLVRTFALTEEEDL